MAHYQAGSKKFKMVTMYKQSTVNDMDLLEVMEIIYAAMLDAEQAARNTATNHLVALNDQMQSRFGIFVKINEEPYLEHEIHRFELQLLKTLERLTKRIEKLQKGKKERYSFEVKGINPRKPLPPQVTEQVILETSKMSERLERSLDKYRQQMAGIRKYIWRSADDNRVRASHRRNDDKIFEWSNPPITGHPGEEFGCRCYAEPIIDDFDQGSFEVAGLGPLFGIILNSTRVLVRQAGKIEKLRRKIKPRTIKPANPKDILNPGGKPIGKAGKKLSVRIETGGDKAAKKLYDSFGEGEIHIPKGYKGIGKKLPNGDWVGYRPISKSGSPTVDIHVRGIPFDKIHFP